MQIKITKHRTEDQIAITRTNGSSASFRVPRKGPVAHDIVHLCVESALGLTNAFWGKVAKGQDPTAIQAMAKAGGHASATRATPPDANLVELLQVERLVECFEAESWSDGTDNAALRAMAETGWAASHVPPIPITDAQIAAVRADLSDIGGRWLALSEDQTLALDWH